MDREDLRSIRFPCLRMKQPIGDVFVGVMPWRDLCDISYFDVRRVIQEERDVERYLGVQRPLNIARVKQLEGYVNFFDASFPTSIILSVDERCAEYDEETKQMVLSNVPGNDANETILFRHIARVLDGQHRIAGLYEFHGEHFDLSVTIFVGMDIADQAHIFATVNLEQTKVNKSLAYDLFALAKSRSPQRTCHDIAVALDSDESGPFFHRIKRLGSATEGRYAETLTQATFVEGVMRYISRNPKEDRDALLRGRTIKTPSRAELEKMPLRGMFAENKDLDIAQIVRNYFDAVRERWPEAWDAGGRGMMLNKTNGFRALMRVFGDFYLEVALPGAVVSPKKFGELFRRVRLTDGDFNTNRYVPGTGGESALVKDLRRDVLGEV